MLVCTPALVSPPTLAGGTIGGDAMFVDPTAHPYLERGLGVTELFGECEVGKRHTHVLRGVTVVMSTFSKMGPSAREFLQRLLVLLVSVLL